MTTLVAPERGIDTEEDKAEPCSARQLTDAGLVHCKNQATHEVILRCCGASKLLCHHHVVVDYVLNCRKCLHRFSYDENPFAVVIPL